MYRSAIPQETLFHLNEIPFSEDYSKDKSIRIDNFIGLGWYWCLNKYQTGNPSDELIAQETVFGWRLSCIYFGKPYNIKLILDRQNALPHNLVKQVWDIESIRISKDEVGNPRESDIAGFMLSFSSNIDDREGRYLPW